MLWKFYRLKMVVSSPDIAGHPGDACHSKCVLVQGDFPRLNLKVLTII